MMYESNYLRSMKNAVPYHINAWIGYKTAALSLFFDHYISFINVNFEDKGSSTLITCPQIHEPILVEESYFLTVFCDELRTLILRETAVKVFKFSVLDKRKYFEDASSENLNTRTTILTNLNEVYQLLVDFLKNQGITLQTALISLEVEDASQLLLVLPFVDRNILKTIFISSIYKQRTIDFQEILKLEIWNSVTTVHIKCLMSLSTPLQHLFKFPSVSVCIEKVSIDELRGVVQACVNNPNLSFFEVGYSEKWNEIESDLLGAMETIDHNGSKVLENSIGRFSIRILPRSLRISRVFDKNVETRDIDQNKDECSKLDSNVSLSVLQNRAIMEHVLGKLALGSIQTLRRVSRGVRQVIDILKPDSKIGGIEIELSDFEAVHMDMIFRDEIAAKSERVYCSRGNFLDSEEINDHLCMIYKNLKINGKCCVDEKSSEVHPLDHFTKDLVFDLQNQKSVIQELCIKAPRLKRSKSLVFGITRERIENLNEDEPDIWKLNASIYFLVLENLLKSLGRLLSVKNLSMQTDNDEDVSKILKNLDPSALSVIEIRKPDTSLTLRGLDINELSTLDQWKHAQELLCEPLISTYQIESFSHFSMIDVHLFTLLLQDMVCLKNKFLSSRTFTKCKIVFDVSDMNENIFEEHGLGFAHLRSPASTGRPSVWFFQFPDHSDLLHILYYEHRSIAFARIPRSKAPDNVVIFLKVLFHIKGIYNITRYVFKLLLPESQNEPQIARFANLASR